MKVLLIAIAVVFGKYASADYLIGVGRADCTGPTVGITFMGYAKTSQVGCGLHLRQYARSFIVDDGTNRALFVSVDTAMIPHGIRREVLRLLEERYGNLYNENNTIISGTHTHGTPGGFMQNVLFDISILGFHNETFLALSDGITQSIIRAHENLIEGRIYLNSGELLDANINRSPASYLLNPEAERAKYSYDVDKDMHQLKFVRSSDNATIGVFNWFAVHGTSMNNTNCLVTSDNVGYASILFEADFNQGYLPGKGPFVGAFAASNLGDVSPNTKGPICINDGQPCDFVSSTCSDGTSKYCIASGPGETMVESTKIIANRLYNKAKELYNSTTTEVTGPVKYIHQYVNMPEQNITITYENGTTKAVSGCRGAMGYSFAGGTTDGPGEFDFTQSTTTDNPFWNIVRDFLSVPTAADIECHRPKAILLNTGGISFPYQWQPHIVATQIFLVGQLALIAVPGEFTTMAGRRLRDTVRASIINNGGPNNTVPIIAGLSNVYTDYITTFEEYQLQRYEGGSTTFGPYTLDIYLNKYSELSAALVTNKTVEPGPEPEDFSDQLISLIPGTVPDQSGIGREFGDCVQQPNETVRIGETVVTKFVSGHPRNNVTHEATFLEVQKLDNDTWTVVATDSSWETRFKFERTNLLLGVGEATIEWDVEEGKFQPGQYRIRHIGYKKNILQEISGFEGVSNNFTVVAA